MALYELAKKEGVIFRFNTQAVDVEPHSGIITLADGEQLSADLIVSADGFYSYLRKYVVENEDEIAEDSDGTKKMVLLSFSLPLEELLLDETLLPLLKPALVRALISFVQLFLIISV
jgi:2-polyprenyl-6-methoxyphenol hydroxylase-like FAD-dependent oxidoreductase